MPAVVVFLGALVVMMVESVVLGIFSVQNWAVQTPVIIAIYIGLERDFVPAAAILAALILPIEWLVGGITGVYSAGLVAIFFAMQILGPNVQTIWGAARGVVAMGAAVLHGLVMVVVLHLMGHGDSVLAGGMIRQIWWVAPVIGVATVILGKGFARVDEMMDPRRGGSDLQL